MKKFCLLIVKIIVLFFVVAYCDASTWEKMYVKKSTDCFRCVKEVSAGGYILAGYTSNLTPNDTDALAVRMNDNGDTLWTFVYNGPSSKEDCFYKVVPTADGGFVFCGYSRSFGSGDNAFYMKLNSNGVMQWVKNWGGSGIDRAQDIVELNDGKFVICGYTTSSPARYYDAFILKIDQSGNTIWTKIYGSTSYDDANSIKVLADDGFIIGGQSNSQLYLIRTNANGDSLWTKAFGTSGIDNIECVNIAQGGDGFVLAGTTDGIGAGGEDGYLVRTDTGGVQLWAKTYGGSLNDGFHRIEQTSDGGYFACGTSSEGPWANPNIWIVKMDGSGNKSWENFYGGEDHDHGYSGQPTSDGGYITCGHTHSFVNNVNLEDALVVKTNSSGQITDYLDWTTVTQLITPVSGGCGDANAQIKIEVANWGNQTVSSIPVTIEITGAITQTLTQTLSSSVTHDGLKTLTFTTTVNMSGGGTYNFHCYTGNPHDIIPANNFLDKSIVVNVTSLSPTVTGDSRCGPGILTLNASSPDPLKWYNVASGGSSLLTGSNYTTPYITSSTTYYVQAGTSCPSARIPVTATITPGLATPTANDGSRCGNGTVVLSGNSAYPIKWYSSSTSMTELNTGANFTTTSISSSATYYISADNGTCSSTRTAVHAVINPVPSVPSTTPANTCGSGTVSLSATAADPVKWYTGSSGGSSIATGNTYTTPVISNTTTYYVLADNGTCQSARIAVIATVDAVPDIPQATSANRCGDGTVVLQANASDPIKWFDAASGGSQIGSGATYTTPAISSTTIYYVLTDNGPCRSSRIPVTATINAIPARPNVTGNSICGAGTTTLQASSSDPVLWYDDVAATNQIGSGNSFMTPAISGTTIFYARSDDGTCHSDAVAVSAVVNALPSVNIGPDTLRTSQSTVTLDAGSGFANYSWSPSGFVQTYNANSSGEYCVTVTDANTCSASACTYVDFSVGISQPKIKSGFKLYPIPSHGMVTVEISKPSGLIFSILDITGKKVYSKTLTSQKEIFDLSFLVKGIYIARLSDEKTSSAYRLVIE
jgi:hypothetical protein